MQSLVKLLIRILAGHVRRPTSLFPSLQNNCFCCGFLFLGFWITNWYPHHLRSISLQWDCLVYCCGDILTLMAYFPRIGESVNPGSLRALFPADQAGMWAASLFFEIVHGCKSGASCEGKIRESVWLFGGMGTWWLVSSSGQFYFLSWQVFISLCVESRHPLAACTVEMWRRKYKTLTF